MFMRPLFGENGFVKSYTAIWFQRRDVAKKPLAHRLTFLIHSLLLKHGENSTYHKRLNIKVIFLSNEPATVAVLLQELSKQWVSLHQTVVSSLPTPASVSDNWESIWGKAQVFPVRTAPSSCPSQKAYKGTDFYYNWCNCRKNPKNLLIHFD